MTCSTLNKLPNYVGVLRWKKNYFVSLTKSKESPISKTFCEKTSSATHIPYYKFTILILFHITNIYYRKTFVFWKLLPLSDVCVSNVHEQQVKNKCFRYINSYSSTETNMCEPRCRGQTRGGWASRLRNAKYLHEESFIKSIRGTRVKTRFLPFSFVCALV